jgi:ubiquinone/menaquinone biosynthesis C-methylase UbiE
VVVLMGLSIKYLQVLKENVRLHKSEAYFYKVQHPEIYNIKEQTRMKQLLTLHLFEMASNVLCVDVGSGTGNICSHLKNLKKEVIACDLSKDMLKENKNAAHRIVCDAGNLPLKDHISNLTSTYSFFHHVPDASKVIREICRITKEKEAKLYFDHDNFTANASFSDKSKFDDPFILFDYLCWLITKPNMIKKFC